MGWVSIIGLDLAKNVFQVHGAQPDGSVAFRRKLSRQHEQASAVQGLRSVDLTRSAGVGERPVFAHCSHCDDGRR